MLNHQSHFYLLSSVLCNHLFHFFFFCILMLAERDTKNCDSPFLLRNWKEKSYKAIPCRIIYTVKTVINYTL